MPLKMRRLTLLVSAFFIFFNTFVYAYDDNDWATLKNENPEYAQFYEINLTLRIAVIGSIDTFRREWFIKHQTVLSENIFCISVAGNNTIPEIWIAVKENNGNIYPHIGCLGHEFLHILKTLGVDVVNPDQRIEKEL